MKYFVFCVLALISVSCGPKSDSGEATSSDTTNIDTTAVDEAAVASEGDAAPRYFSQTLKLDTAGSVAPILVYVQTYRGNVPGKGNIRVKLELDPDYVNGIVLDEKGVSTPINLQWVKAGETLDYNGITWKVSDDGVEAAFEKGAAPVKLKKDPLKIPDLTYEISYKTKLNYGIEEVYTDIIEVSNSDGLWATWGFESNKPFSSERQNLKLFFEDLDGDGDADVRYFENFGDEGIYYDEFIYNADNNEVVYVDEWGNGKLYEMSFPKKK